MLKLLLKDGQGYREREFNQDRVTIGRAADNTLVLDHPKVSRNHARIERGPEGYRISDLGSGNGTLVNGTKVLSCILFRGDEIRIGETEILVLSAGTPAPVPQLTTDRLDRGGPTTVAAEPPSPPPPATAAGRRTTGRVPKVTVGRVAREAASIVPHLLGKLLGVLLLIGVIGAAIYVAWQIRLRWSLEEASLEPRQGGSDSGRAPGPPKTAAASPEEEVEARIRAELQGGRYRRAEEILREYSAAAGRSGGAVVSFLTTLVLEAVEADFRQVEAEGRRLQEAGRYEEAARHYADCAGRFEGTEHHRYLLMKPAILEKLAKSGGGKPTGGPAAAPSGPDSSAGGGEVGEVTPFDVLKAFVIVKVQEGVPVELAGGTDPEAGSLARVARADDRQVWIDTGQLEQSLSWRQLGEAGLLQMSRSLVPTAPVPVQVAYLRLAARLGRGRFPEVQALLASLRERSPAAAREFESTLGSAPEPPSSPPSEKPSPKVVPEPPPPKPPTGNPPLTEPPPPPPPPADPPDKAVKRPEPTAPEPPTPPEVPSSFVRTDRRKMPMNLIFAPHELVGEGDSLRGNGAAGPVPEKGNLLAASGLAETKVFVCVFASGREGMARGLALSAGREVTGGVRTFTNPPVPVSPQEGAGEGAFFQKPRVGEGVEDIESRRGNTFFTVFACGGSSCLSVLGVPPAHWDYNGTVRVGTRPTGVALSFGDPGEKYAFAACQGDGTIAAVLLHEEGPLRRGDRIGETVYFDASTGKQIETRPASQQIIDSDGRGGGQSGFSTIPGAPGPASRAGQSLGIEDVALLQRGPWTGGAAAGKETKEAYLFVSNTKGGSVSVFNAAPFLAGKSRDLVLLGRIVDIPNPKKLLVAAGRYLWVGSHPGTAVFRVDLIGLPSWPLRPPEAVGVGKNPAFMAWLPTQGGFLMVANSGSDSISVVRGDREIGRLDAANSAPMAGPWGLWISGFGDRMIATNREEAYATWWNLRLYPEASLRGPQELLLGSGNVWTGSGVLAIDGVVRP